MSKEETIKNLKKLKSFHNGSYGTAIDEAIKAFEQQPKTGKWIFVHPLQEDDEGAYMCSCCGVGNWGIDPKVDKYCFNCGARMNGGDEE